MPLEPGLVGRAELRVSEADTAIAFRSGRVPVLATPRLVALCEEASMDAVEGRLEPGQTTVGMTVQLSHLSPTAVGDTLTAEATLEKVEGRRLAFTVSATDSGGLVGAGKVTRVVVEEERFLNKLRRSDAGGG